MKIKPIKHKTRTEIEREMLTAIKMDVRDNPKLQGIIRDLVKESGKGAAAKFALLFKEDIEREYSGMPGPVLFPWTRSAIKTIEKGEESFEQFGLGVIGAVIGLVGVGVSLTGNYLISEMQLDAQQDIAELQVAGQAAQADAAVEIAKENRAAEEAKLAAVLAQQGILPGVSPGTTGGPAAEVIPGISTTTLLLVGGGAIFLIFVLPKLMR